MLRSLLLVEGIYLLFNGDKKACLHKFYLAELCSTAGLHFKCRAGDHYRRQSKSLERDPAFLLDQGSRFSFNACNLLP